MNMKRIIIDVIKSLSRNKRQSILTAISFAISVFVVLFILSSSSFTTNSIAQGVDLDNQTTTLNFHSNNLFNKKGFTKADSELIEKKFAIKSKLHTSSYDIYVESSLNKMTKPLSIRTVQQLAENDLSLPTIVYGKGWSQIKNSVQEIAISDQALRSLVHENNIAKYLKKEIILQNQKYKIATIYQSSSISEQYPAIIVSEQIVNQVFHKQIYYDELILTTSQEKKINQVLKVLDQQGENRLLGSYQWIDKKAIYEETKSQADTILNFIALLASISIFVSGFGVMNAMLSSISERSQEISMRRALGAKKRVIMITYLMEGSLLSLFGGVVGTIIAGVFIIMMNFMGMQAMVSGMQVMITLLATLFFGMLFSVLPAMVAAHKNIAEGLR
ncbi:ABC transporter permease [Enterococcus columbae]|uniref:ABC3 transporter permease C-terminal domain-containing protein n=1 Tax=Enterococcus columbae DSM 7374 = ATCC 51263 TaxID=1121865 RepID=S1NGJ9_9ENTE|nr:FtsX-like permease family protein [Enterococcus columbae]EOT39138.1 hypothetical protein OMW_02015 [Enterococcus columbae DSM 7374 = ATCC 51263]EOW79929.1 hypothetical protein I568_02280 [Enterococcus columbae DSM 7374 = ATCC 51263]